MKKNINLQELLNNSIVIMNNTSFYKNLKKDTILTNHTYKLEFILLY